MTTPYAWAIATDDWFRVGFEPHELALALGSEKVLAEVEDHFRLTHPHLLRDDTKITIHAIVPDDVEQPATIRDFVR